jgi:hypothetical protein
MLLSKLFRKASSSSLIHSSKCFISNGYVSELFDENYDKQMIGKMIKIHENIKKDGYRNFIHLSEKAEQNIFSPFKAIIEGFSNKFQKSLLFANNLKFFSASNRKTRNKRSVSNLA